MNAKDHWNRVYQTKAPDDVSWFQTEPSTSLKLIKSTGVQKNEGIIDIGGGASTLVDFLLDLGFKRLAVLDISATALAHSKERLGKRGAHVDWLEADVTEFVPRQKFSVWHDRAVFHFLTNKENRNRYVETMRRTLWPGGHIIIATFALDGPIKCSGLDVARYDAKTIADELGPEFKLIEQTDETHVTPWNTEQRFGYFRFTRIL